MAAPPPDTTVIAQALKGVDFPCDRDMLVQYARDRQADEGAVDVLARLAPRRYESMADILHGLGGGDDTGGEPPPFVIPASDVRSEVLNPWLWMAEGTLRYWQFVGRLIGLWWPPPGGR
ncbi:DUF2795 domain-containing protein [Magnetospirillum sp. UT-4]|uniref:DUF2795 domain-containing protein n=1 Tax=Magnetospirillum sp. UT-4 TaxID=2681467 RepID=UPI0013814C0D|nr:DUF2795 domain-containing protein [Magnetospirillum sp. UT-4]CAA7620545.1 conserved hypothetical protein [Magnetospirillum sp. UT-4]